MTAHHGSPAMAAYRGCAALAARRRCLPSLPTIAACHHCLLLLAIVAVCHEAAGSPATEMGRKRTVLAGEPDAELLIVVGGDCGGKRVTWPMTTEPGRDV